MPVIGMMPIVMPDVLEHLEREHRQARRRTRARRRSPARAGLFARSATSRGRRDRAARRAPRKPSSSPTDVKMKSVCCSGTKPPWVCEPSPRPSPANRPCAMACFDCSWLYALPCEFAFPGSTNEVNRSIWYCFRIPRFATAYTPVIASNTQHEELAPGEAGRGEQPHDDDDQHEHRAEVGLEEHEPDRYRREREDRGDAPRVELTAVLVAVAGERHDDAELGELRRLEREATRQLEPRLVTLDVRPERREHREQAGRRSRCRRPSSGRADAGSRSRSPRTWRRCRRTRNSAWRLTK